MEEMNRLVELYEQQLDGFCTLLELTLMTAFTQAMAGNEGAAQIITTINEQTKELDPNMRAARIEIKKLQKALGLKE